MTICWALNNCDLKCVPSNAKRIRIGHNETNALAIRIGMLLDFDVVQLAGEHTHYCPDIYRRQTILCSCVPITAVFKVAANFLSGLLMSLRAIPFIRTCHQDYLCVSHFYMVRDKTPWNPIHGCKDAMKIISEEECYFLSSLLCWSVTTLNSSHTTKQTTWEVWGF
jgi:hypothetical protein